MKYSRAPKTPHVAGTAYFTGDNGNLFFSPMVTKMTHILPKSAEKYLHGIDFYANLVPFSIKNRPAVVEVLKAQKEGIRAIRDGTTVDDRGNGTTVVH